MRSAVSIVAALALGAEVVAATGPGYNWVNWGSWVKYNNHNPAPSPSPCSTAGGVATSSISAPTATASIPAQNVSAWDLTTLTSVVFFGDSYTDEGRLGQFIGNGGAPPPPGYRTQITNGTADGGYIWARYVGWYTGANIYNYAVSGAVCSNNVSPRWFGAINASFPAVEQYEVPAFVNDSKLNDGTNLTIPADQTVYAIWIGTNDLGNDAFLYDSQINNTTLTNYTDCVYNQLDTLYANGGRYFVILNNAPLDLVPQYSLNPPLAATQYFQNKPEIFGGNNTLINKRIQEEVATTNQIFRFQTPYEVLVANRYPNASIALYDVHALMTDIYYNPSAYLNGTAPLNVTGVVNACNTTGQACVRSSNPDAFEWFDELHPSEQTERVIAMNFVDVVRGVSKWATYYSS